MGRHPSVRGAARCERLASALRLYSLPPFLMSDQSFTGTSSTGDLGDALQSAVGMASRGLNANFFAWRLA
jgi:hypothetical protein